MGATLAAFQGRHDGESIVVCGCGPSLTELAEPQRFTTIGVNDVGRLFDPSYLVVVNPRSQFKGDRFRYVETSKAQALFTQLDLGPVGPPVVRFKLGRYGGTDTLGTGVLNHTQNSPYVAVCLAAHMGATRIGLIGVDLTDHHFFAATGRHPLAGRLREIDQQYARLAEALRQRGVELVNLSSVSRLTALPRTAFGEFERTANAPARVEPSAHPDAHAGSEIPARVPVLATVNGIRRADVSNAQRVFVVDYRFLSCGDVFGRGLANAARALGIEHAGAWWDDPALPQKLRAFAPDLVLVVHGRRFAQRYSKALCSGPWKSAVWLLDEPYEVDETSRWSSIFDFVFINDPATLARHRNAHPLAVCFDPSAHCDPGGGREHRVGFIGGYNPVRERFLVRLADEGLLSYVVGGPWKSPALQRIRLGANCSPQETARLYQRTQIVLNVFRSVHHFNRNAVPANSINPRIYEALGCGALVVSERRAEVSEVFPELPTFADADSLIPTIRQLLSDEPRRRELLEKCRARLAGHSYADRLASALRICLGTEIPPLVPSVLEETLMNAMIRSTDSVAAASTAPLTFLAPPPDELPALRRNPPTYSILMVVHNACRMVQISTLRTLRHIVGQDARLVVVDNASNDGVERWLDLLAARGDIDLLRNEKNVGHGPALEQARRATASPYLVALDSDAFPLIDDWLPALRARLGERVRAAGILHHRGYIHPSCMMVARETLDDFGLTFLIEKRQPMQLDVGRSISVEIEARGYEISGLQRTASRRRGGQSEPVDLGSTYEGLVYHQWYTTRADIAGTALVDDVPSEAIARSLEEVFSEFAAEPREVTVVMGIRAAPDQPERLRNALAALHALNVQTLARWRYRIVVVEQDGAPRLREALAPLADAYVFAWNPGLYNRSWGLNVGAVSAGAAQGVLCLIDADILVPPDFLERGLRTHAEGCRAFQPYRGVHYLTPGATLGAIAERQSAPLAVPNVSGPEPPQSEGQLFTDSRGGCIWVDSELYRKIGGHDERFQGWGAEDREFHARLSRMAAVPQLPGVLLHLDHPAARWSDQGVAANQRLHRGILAGTASATPLDIGRLDLYSAPGRVPSASRPRAVAEPAIGLRPWERWHRWPAARIEQLVRQEAALPPAASALQRLAQVLPALGDTLLDVGCGPGALWTHLAAHRPRFAWGGVDSTAAMLSVAKRNFPDVPTHHADAAALPFDDGSFDLVLLRHVLDHLPSHLLRPALLESARVARKAVAVVFWVPPAASGEPATVTVGDGFLETRWPVEALTGPIRKAGWEIADRFTLAGSRAENDDVWILMPAAKAGAYAAGELAPRPAENLKISVVMPTYRRPHTLSRTVATILAQSYRNWELIIVDNAGDVAASFNDPRIRVHVHAQLPSASGARNEGIAHATGDLVCFFDDDDDMFPSYLSQFAATFQANPDAKIVCCGMVLSSGTLNFSHATPECMMLRRFAKPSWPLGSVQDQLYFDRTIAANRWSERAGDIVTIPKILCRANTDPSGGLRAGRY